MTQSQSLYRKTLPESPPMWEPGMARRQRMQASAHGTTHSETCRAVCNSGSAVPFRPSAGGFHIRYRLSFSFVQLQSASFSFSQLRSASVSFVQLRPASFSFVQLRSASFSFSQPKNPKWFKLVVPEQAGSNGWVVPASYTVPYRKGSFDEMEARNVQNHPIGKFSVVFGILLSGAVFCLSRGKKTPKKSGETIAKGRRVEYNRLEYRDL